MKKLVLVSVLFLSLSVISMAQETVVWGSEIVDVSSEFSPLEYSAIQALHKPNVLPSGGDNPNAWRPKSQDNLEFIMISFDDPIIAQQIAIAESENPGAIKEIYAYDEQYNEYKIFDLTPRQIPLESRLLNLFFEETTYKVYAVKVVLDGEAIPGYNAIDAIGISKSNIPINVLINLAPGVGTVSVDRLGGTVNSTYIEHSPLISPDGKRLYFSRRYHPDNIGGSNDSEDIWVSELDEANDTWKTAVNVGPPLNTEGPNFISSITIVNGVETLILGNKYGKKGRMYTGTSISTRNGDSFEKPVSLEIENEYNYSPKADFFLVPDGKSLVMSQERDDSYGGRDLYVSFERGGSWTQPMNLGIQINTSGEDFAPFLGQDGKTMYFSSNGISGYGGSDIYVTIRLDETWTKWSVPENLGSGINSAEDDQYFSIPSSGKHIYFARGKIDEDTDIFRFKAEDLYVEENDYTASVEHLVPDEPKEVFVVLMGNVLDAKTKEALSGSKVLLERLPDGLALGSVVTPIDASFSFLIRGGARYGIAGELDGYLSESQNFDFNDLKESDTVRTDILMSKIEKGVSIVLKNIFFAFDKADLKTSSYTELRRLLKYMQNGDIDKIQISGHTDSYGEDDYNKSLSERRSRAVVDYLVTNNISRDRLTYAGYGETQPVAPNDTKENRQLNRRVEFKIVE
ncbi:MAG: OOP family OmpA-OmpF porin [Cyclobacteriaceae bacterium]|jgi:OOP family OmpA-OmpF porin